MAFVLVATVPVAGHSVAFETNATRLGDRPFSDKCANKSRKSETGGKVVCAAMAHAPHGWGQTPSPEYDNARMWALLIAQIQKMRRPRLWPLWPARVNKIRGPKSRSLWPFAMPIGLTILPSLEAARLYPWWVATLVFNVVWITLKLWDDRIHKKNCSLFRRALVAVSIVILAQTVVLASTIDVCGPDRQGCLRELFLKPVRFAAGFAPGFTRR